MYLLSSIPRSCSSLLPPADVAGAAVSQMYQQRGKHRDVGAGADRKVQIGDVATRGAPRIDDHITGAALLPCIGEPAVQHRMAPSSVAPYEHGKFGLVDVVVTAGHQVLAKAADMAGDRRGHAEP